MKAANWFCAGRRHSGFLRPQQPPARGHHGGGRPAEVADGNILRLIEKFLPLGGDGERCLSNQEPRWARPKEASSSPLLANIVLNHLDWHLHQHGLRFVRYADDFVVVTPSQPQAEEARKQVEQVLGALEPPS